MKPTSKTTVRLASLWLLAVATGLSFVVVLAGALVTPCFRALYGLNSLDEAWDLMPAITRLASDHSWVIALLFGLLCLGSLRVLRHPPNRALQSLTLGLCPQGLVAWSAAFCYCYDGFTGPMCLHHGPQFEWLRFACFGAGVFPVTLMLIITPLAAALWPSGTLKNGFTNVPEDGCPLP